MVIKPFLPPEDDSRKRKRPFLGGQEGLFQEKEDKSFIFTELNAIAMPQHKQDNSPTYKNVKTRR
jgi:hypothetical protein